MQATWIPVGSCYQLGGLNFSGWFRFSVPALGTVAVQAEGHAAYQKYRFLISEAQKKKPSSSPSPALSGGGAEARRLAQPPSPIETLRVGKIDFQEYVRVLPGADTASEAFWDRVRAAPLDSQQITYLTRAQEALRQPDTSSASSNRFRFSPDEEGLWWRWSRRREPADRWGVEWGVLWPSYTLQEGWALPVVGRLRRGKGSGQWGASVTLRYGWGWKRMLPAARLSWSSTTFPGWGVEVQGGLSPQEPTDRVQVPLLWNGLYRLARAPLPWQGYIRPFCAVEGKRYLHRTLQARLRLSWDERPAGPEGTAVYSAWRGALALEWQPGTRLFQTPRAFLLDMPAKVFAYRLRGAVETAWIADQPLFTGSLEVLSTLSISPLGALETQIGLAWQNKVAPWADALYPVALPLLLHRSPSTLMRYPAYAPAGPYLAQGVCSWTPQGAFLRAIPLLRKLPLREQIVVRVFSSAQKRWHAELSAYLIFSSKRLAFLRGLSGGAHWNLERGLRSVTFSLGTTLLDRGLLVKPALL
ncbi:MAG: hypothetical protein D6750_01790 [Bacteroidetes bacterium]|nr:MAG: hypothetical protein D6750_01790 [Bacteroidota bacterium]